MSGPAKPATQRRSDTQMPLLTVAKKLILAPFKAAFRLAYRYATRTVTPPFGDSFWYATANLWEPAVQLALRDLCRPGNIVFDVGANLGGLTSLMARLVGPRGIVCSFEASPRIIGHLQANVVKQGHNNVTVYHNAVFSKSNALVPIYPGSHLNDSLYGTPAAGEASFVRTITLDDFSSVLGMVPSLIKMDIEGAEYDALLGAEKLITEHKPHLILEQQNDDAQCLNLLLSKGYRAVDLNSYKPISSLADYPPKAHARNVLFIHQTRLHEWAVDVPCETEHVATLSGTDFARKGDGAWSSRTVTVAPGRYLIDVHFSASGTGNDLLCGVRLDGQLVFRYCGYSKLLADSYRDWVVDVPMEAPMELCFEFTNGTSDASFELSGADVRRIKGFVPQGLAGLLAP